MNIILSVFFAAMADAAYQEVAVQVGWQDHFSLKEVIETGVEAYIGAKYMPASTASYSQLIKGAAEVLVADQLIDMALGLETKFNFKALLANLAAIVATKGLDDELNINSSGYVVSAVRTTVNTAVSAGIDSAIEGNRFNISEVGADAIGTIAGEDLGEAAEPVALAGKKDVDRWSQRQGSAQRALRVLEQDIDNVGTALDDMAQGIDNDVSSLMGRVGLFGRRTTPTVSGTPTVAPRQTAPSQSQRTQASASASYGSGNTSPTSKSHWLNSNTTDSGRAVDNVPWLDSSPDQLLASAGIDTSDITVSSSIASQVSPSNQFSQVRSGVNSGILESIEGVAIGGAISVLENMPVIGGYVSYNAPQPSLSQISSGIKNTFLNLDSSDPYLVGNSVGKIGFFVISSAFGGEALMTDVAETNAGVQLADKAGGVINTGGRQLVSVKNVLNADEEATKFYQSIRSNPSNNDVKLISKNTGIPEFQVQRIKEHIFFNTHDISIGAERFSPDIEIADAWTRLQNGNFVKQDLQLLQHEYFESRFEGIFKTDYITAHNAAINSMRTWDPLEFKTTPDMTWRP